MIVNEDQIKHIIKNLDAALAPMLRRTSFTAEQVEGNQFTEEPQSSAQ
jgi:hypothetical protein